MKILLSVIIMMFCTGLFGQFIESDYDTTITYGITFAFSNKNLRVLSHADSAAIKCKANKRWPLHECTWFSPKNTAICTVCHIDSENGNLIELEKLACPDDLKVTHNLIQAAWYSEGPRIIVKFFNDRGDPVFLVWYWDTATRELKLMTS